MKTATIGTAQDPPELFAQTNSGAIPPGQRTKRPPTERHRHEEWKQRIEEYWQNHLETLQRCVRELLRENQQPGMAFATANKPERGYGNAIHP